jgi:DNA end-binding protein Ku
MITLRRSEQVLALPAVQPASLRAPSEAELKLAAQLVDSISCDFEPAQWHNEYRERLHALIDAKLHGH